MPDDSLKNAVLAGAATFGASFATLVAGWFFELSLIISLGFAPIGSFIATWVVGILWNTSWPNFVLSRNREFLVFSFAVIFGALLTWMTNWGSQGLFYEILHPSYPDWVFFATDTAIVASVISLSINWVLADSIFDGFLGDKGRLLLQCWVIMKFPQLIFVILICSTTATCSFF